DHAGDIVRACDVSGNGPPVPSILPDEGYRLGQPVGRASRDHDQRALAGERPGRGAADPRAAAGDQHDLVGESGRHTSSPFDRVDDGSSGEEPAGADGDTSPGVDANAARTQMTARAAAAAPRAEE